MMFWTGYQFGGLNSPSPAVAVVTITVLCRDSRLANIHADCKPTVVAMIDSQY